jgi:hypothetical protein
VTSPNLRSIRKQTGNRGCTVKITLHRVQCHAKTESGEDEIYCVVTTGDAQGRELARVDVGRFEIGRDVQPEKLLWQGNSVLLVRLRFMENDAGQPGHGSDDFIGEVSVSRDGACLPGHCTLDEGFAEGQRFRQFAMTGSGASYVVQLTVQ